MKFVLATLLVIFAQTASATVTNCQFQLGQETGVIVVTADTTSKLASVQTQLTLGGQSIPSLVNSCILRPRGLHCAHGDMTARYDIFVHKLNKVGGVVRVGLVSWNGTVATRAVVEQACDDRKP